MVSQAGELAKGRDGRSCGERSEAAGLTGREGPAGKAKSRLRPEWLGFIQPTGLVVSAIALVQAGAILNRRDIEGQRLLEECVEGRCFRPGIVWDTPQELRAELAERARARIESSDWDEKSGTQPMSSSP